MVKSNFDSTEMSKVIKSLDDGSKKIGETINSIIALDIPSFSYSGWLESLPNLLTSCNQVCSLDSEWCTGVIEKFNNFNTESISDIRSVEVQTEFSKEYNVNNL